MPIIAASSYRAPFFFRNAHLNTVYPAFLRTVSAVAYQRERWFTPDADFLDLDWSRVGSDQLVIVLHGLEGSAQRPYVKGMIRAFNAAGWDGLGFNFRSCSGEPNRQVYSYHMGATKDLDWLLRHPKILQTYRKIVLIGYSLGGNVTLKYLGQQGSRLPSQLQAAVAFSVPTNIARSNMEMNKWKNRLYLNRFIHSLMQKLRGKADLLPSECKARLNSPVRNFNTFDAYFTAPINGFNSAADYWEKCSCGQYLDDIRLPTLLISAKDDTFLSRECYPFSQAKQHSYLYLEVPANGGHVGFVTLNEDGSYWSEARALQFVREMS